MIKLCRNTLGDWGVIHDGDENQIKWEYFEKLVIFKMKLVFTLQQRLETGIRINYKKMKVKL